MSFKRIDFLIASFVLMLASVYIVYGQGAQLVTVDDAEAVSNTTLGQVNNLTEAVAGGIGAEGGNTSELNLSKEKSTEKWQGYFGSTSGILRLGLATRAFFTFDTPQVRLLVASTNNALNLALLSNMSLDNKDPRKIADGAFSFNDTAAELNEKDNVNRTYDDGPNNATQIGNITGLNIANLSDNTGKVQFQPAILIRNTYNSTAAAAVPNDIAFAVNVTDEGVTDFRGTTSDYEILVPVAQAEDGPGTTTYFFWLDIQ